MAAICVPIISESEYPSFAAIGVSSEFPVDFSSFFERCRKKAQEHQDMGIITVDTQIDFAGFRAWFAEKRPAVYSDLVRYASTVKR